MRQSSNGTRSVVIVQRILAHYRVAFFDALQKDLAGRSIRLGVVYGQHVPGTVPQSVSVQHPWARFVGNRYFSAIGRELVWQPIMGATRDADLVIVEHAARLLGNYPLFARRVTLGQRLAYWGHGANLQATNRDSLSERFKRYLINKPDWWFAYTTSSKTAVQRVGYPEERITVVQNAIDETELKGGLEAVTSGRIEDEKHKVGLRGSRIALYCGGMYPDKRLDFLLSACLKIKALVPDFEMIFIGSGPDQGLVENACSHHNWMHFIGPKFGEKRALFFAMSRVSLMPGMVGLAIVDSFVAGVPLFTTNIPTHSPEIDYLENGTNGIITEHSVDEYAKSVAHYLENAVALERLRVNCLTSAGIYTLGNMVKNFSEGVEACLVAPRR
jgi:L-malate glycosyltransferase